MPHPAERSTRGAGDGGVAVVEFALVLPVLMMLLLGMLSGATAWNQNMSMGHGARVAARHAATLPLPDTPTEQSVHAWLDGVTDLAVGASVGVLDAGPGRTVCVAYVHPAGTSPLATTSRTLSPTGTRTSASTPCFDDGQQDAKRRIQVVVGRTGLLDTGLYRQSLVLRQQVVYAYEAHVGL